MINGLEMEVAVSTLPTEFLDSKNIRKALPRACSLQLKAGVYCSAQQLPSVDQKSAEIKIDSEPVETSDCDEYEDSNADSDSDADEDYQPGSPVQLAKRGKTEAAARGKGSQRFMQRGFAQEVSVVYNEDGDNVSDIRAKISQSSQSSNQSTQQSQVSDETGSAAKPSRAGIKGRVAPQPRPISSALSRPTFADLPGSIRKVPANPREFPPTCQLNLATPKGELKIIA
jgi:hypothetical protein